MAAPTRKVALRIENVVLYDDGAIDRAPHELPPLPACPKPPSIHQVATLDLPLNEAKGTSLRLFKPPVHHKVPLLLYFHGGGFIFGSSTLPADHSFLCKLAAHTPTLIVSVEYRLAPEHPLPAAYEDGIEALLWLHNQLLVGEDASHPWIFRYAEFSRCFLGGDSAGANMAHHVGLWACASWCTADVAACAVAMDGLSLQGVILIHPFFTCGSERIAAGEATVWKSAGVGTDHPFSNPLLLTAPSLANAALPSYLVAVASDDMFVARGHAFHQGLVDAGKRSRLFVSEGEPHVFHIHTPDSKNVPVLLDELRGFINNESMRNGISSRVVH